MAVYQIVKIGDAILRQRAKEVTKVNDSILKLINNMADTMYDGKGVGLAAPQIGVSKRVIVYDVGNGIEGLINPEILSYEKETDVMVEGCLSIPGVEGEVERPVGIEVRGINSHGQEVRFKAEALLARVLQHEIDHLNGILFVDRVTRFVGENKET